MTVHFQPRANCPVCDVSMTPCGSTGTQDLYRCLECGKMQFVRWQERRGSVRKSAEDDPIEVMACSGEIEICTECGHAERKHGIDRAGYLCCDHPFCDCGWHQGRGWISVYQRWMKKNDMV